ncbi:MAG: TRAP transporter small permease subunit, partial [Peptostreptococcus porci]|nr:TRAP transporter small permease subunit [Peptostreptococcus porci]
FFMLMLYFSIMVVRESFVSGQTSPALGVPIWLVYLPVVVGSFLSVCRVVEKIIESENNVDSKADSF